MLSDRVLRRLWRQSYREIEFETFRSLFVATLDAKGGEHIDNILNQLQVAANKARDDTLVFMSSRFALACYSETSEDFLMWSHYTFGHQGMVIEFNIKNDFFAKAENLMPVTYRSERVSTSYGKQGLDFDEPEIALVRSKNLCWSYEKEWRQLFPLRECQKLHVDGRGVGYFQPLPADAISSVILGVRCRPDTEAAVRELVDRPDLKHVKVRRAVLHETDFRLKIV